MFFSSLNLNLVLLASDDVLLLQLFSLALTLALMYCQISVHGFYFGKQRLEVRSVSYHLLGFCLQLILVSAALFFANGVYNPFSRPCLNPYFIALLILYLYFSLK